MSGPLEGVPDGRPDGQGGWEPYVRAHRSVCEVCDAEDGTHMPHCVVGMEESLRRTHHDVGSAEERYSRQMRADKYLAMQQLLTEIAAAAPDDNHAMQIQPRARAILAGMVRPRGPAVRATDRAEELEVLLYAYRVPARVLDAEGLIAKRAAALTIEALKAWERAHPPAPLDPLLL